MKKPFKMALGFLPRQVLRNCMGQRPWPVTSLSTPIEAIYSQSDLVFEVPAEKCKYTYQFSYGLKGWHPFVVTLRQYMEEGIDYESSELCRYYRTFQPKTLLELFFEGNEERELENSRLAEWRIGTHYPILPWDPGLVEMQGEGGLSVVEGLQGFGPVSREKGEYEFARLIGTYESIRRKGYCPTRDSDGEIRGYFLRMGEDSRFVIRAGFHRAAVLSALGHERIRVKFKSNFPRAVDLADIRNWPLVRKGVLEQDVAERIFTRFFTDDGTRKARNLGLL